MREITDVEEIQGVLLETLDYFKSFCQKNNLKYFLSNGTLLGAVKYNQFIPWDDDVDIMMPREDYDKLLSLSEIDNGTYKLMSTKTVLQWRMPYSKLSDMRTVLKEGEFDFGAEFGISVDIFPIDNWSDNKYIARAQALYCEILKRLLISSNDKCFSTPKKGVKKLILYAIYVTGKALGHKRIYRMITRRAEKSLSSKGKNVGCVVWTCHGSNGVLPADVFAQQKFMRFCNSEYPIPSGYEKYLDKLYGEWRKELPPDKQKSNHNIKVWWKDE